ncbi:SusD/RagB family nutrient-binding outer membrane lipoprotein [Pedobacter sp. GR22-6]|uniref:SusD/RagB family nutrient-binding outer membrane lipoprotein n=1 Tax=Pedobacter sp. GR22-6 TaxID=3127957 RepID=UPI00307EE2A9
MKKMIYTVFVMFVLLMAAGCKKWLDVNENPNGPEKVSPNLLLAPMLYYVVQADQWDGRYVGKYIQNWSGTGDKDIWDTMGYQPPPVDNGGETWKLAYIFLGKNLSDMMRDAEAEKRWDVLGVGYILKAIGFQRATDMHGELIIKQIGQDRTSFDYDSQEYAYEEVRKLLDTAIVNLQRIDGTISKSYLAKGDLVYNGAKEQWLKFAYGMMAINLSHLTNKSTFDADKVIEYVDKSFTGNVDNALYTFTGGQSALSNFWGQRRANLNAFRQTEFFVNLLNGTAFPGIVDPRMSRMIWPSPSGIYKGIQPTFALTTISPAADRPPTFFNTVGNVLESSPGRYLFDDVAKIPLMTYSQLQFIKAEAALRKGYLPVAMDAYKKGIDAHIDFVNTTNSRVPTGTASQISATEKAAYLSNVNIVPAAETQLTLSHILCQKYIAQFAWGFLETWTDLRRFHYTDLDPKTNQQVFRGFAPPDVSRLSADNLGKVVYRFRPRYASEYVWNIEALKKIGGTDIDFTTKPTWFVNP